jgi:hypothetical protein
MRRRFEKNCVKANRITGLIVAVLGVTLGCDALTFADVVMGQTRKCG